MQIKLMLLFYGLSPPKKMDVVEGWPLVELRIYTTLRNERGYQTSLKQNRGRGG